MDAENGLHILLWTDDQNTRVDVWTDLLWAADAVLVFEFQFSAWSVQFLCCFTWGIISSLFHGEYLLEVKWR